MASYLHDGILVYLEGLVDWDHYFHYRKGDGVDVDAERAALRGVLETCGEVCAEIEPMAREGWEKAAVLEDGEVVKPEHIRRGYEMLRDAGLVSLSVKEEHGGFELPALLSNIVLQMVSRADAGLMTIVGLQAGVAEDIQSYASDELCAQYLPGFASGEFQGAMDLTEPRAGSDLGGITTRATQEGERWFVDGEKIFITNGGAEVHLVLARDDDTFDQSKGTTRGLSLFLCPRTMPDGSRNPISIERLEHKLGIHGSPTAVVRFERAEGFLVGKKGDGFKAMLQLMNNARLGVAAQGVGIAEAALEEAVRYARERKQFGAAIADQPLMKNMLARMVLGVEGSRALLYRCCALIDRNSAIEAYLAREGDRVPDAERADLQRVLERNTVRTRLMTPLAKYLATETADTVSRMAVQVHGGLGFMAESVVGRLHLDGIITTIYEGTSEIQISFALKEIGKGALGIVFEEISADLDKLAEEPLAGLAEKVREGIARINESSVALMQDFNYALLCARPVAEMVIDVIVAAELLRQAHVRPERTDLAASWVNRRMLEVELHARRVAEGTVDRIARCERIISLVD
ncbi:MAG: acyl-CoA dehydrogenase family protein [Deltaproteobacteria bacterium]|nr:acyl-CoA dehydrogenase family protein [Deltaproteobacteria bacterium]MBW2413171.1 acyl-CoA dehydrogenase family protein [Deltaproteobacteria bacterium]